MRSSYTYADIVYIDAMFSNFHSSSVSISRIKIDFPISPQLIEKADFTQNFSVLQSSSEMQLVFMSRMSESYYFCVISVLIAGSTEWRK